MKFVLSFIIYCLVYLPVAVLSYIFLEEYAFIGFNAVGLLSWFFTYIYIDRILLVFLGAREVIDTDEHRFFQIVKNNAYRNRVDAPRIYIYSGNYEGCFLLESLSRWTVVLDKSFLRNLSDESTQKLIEFLYAYHITGGKGYLKTKALGICVLFYTFVYWVLKNLFLQKTNSKYFKSLAAFTVIMTRPFMYPLEFILRQSSKIKVDVCLKQYSSQLKAHDTFSNYLSGLVLENQKLKDLIIQYVEGYPLLLECEYSHDH